MYRLCDGIKFLKGLPDQSVDGIFMDPPWGGRTKILGQDRWETYMRQIDKECPRILRPNARVLIWFGCFRWDRLFRCFKNLEYRWNLQVRTVPSSYAAQYNISMAPIFYFSLPGQKVKTAVDTNKIDQLITVVSDGKARNGHPCPRDEKAVHRVIREWYRPGEYVVDPFAGSDTTGYACRELNIRNDSCELDPEMFKHGRNRHRQGLLFETTKGG